jgi:hypothetical protein
MGNPVLQTGNLHKTNTPLRPVDLNISASEIRSQSEPNSAHQLLLTLLNQDGENSGMPTLSMIAATLILSRIRRRQLEDRSRIFLRGEEQRNSTGNPILERISRDLPEYMALDEGSPLFIGLDSSRELTVDLNSPPEDNPSRLPSLGRSPRQTTTGIASDTVVARNHVGTETSLENSIVSVPNLSESRTIEIASFSPLQLAQPTLDLSPTGNMPISQSAIISPSAPPRPEEVRQRSYTSPEIARGAFDESWTLEQITAEISRLEALITNSQTSEETNIRLNIENLIRIRSRLLNGINNQMQPSNVRNFSGQVGSSLLTHMQQRQNVENEDKEDVDTNPVSSFSCFR